ncbi:spore germination protein B3 precursor [Clostridium magnum DSM 2767]|uniref:Spore germination protein B3 n=2 Tax=Clostridium magnum TaxID=33954 RepID=A0A161YNV2_9CLOT|nr:spore germination protein B3 precursor [Clostridium magnum DSM 2767]
MLTICFTINCTTGCWNNRDLTKRSFAVAVGIDKNEENKIEVTMQVVKPQMIKGTSEGGLRSKENAVWTLSSTGETTFDAIRNFLKMVDRKIFLTHIQIIVIGERLAREGVMETLDFFERDQEANFQSFVLVAKNITAKEIINAKTGIGQIPAVHITDTLKNNTALSKTKDTKLFDLMKDIRSSGKNAIIGTIETSNNRGGASVENMKIEGTAAFEKDKMIGWLDAKQTRGILFAEDKVKSTIIYFSDPSKEDKKVSIEVLRSEGKKYTTAANGKPEFNIQIKLDGNIGEQQSAEDLTKPNNLKIIESETSKIIESEIQDVVSFAKKELKSDIFGFGELFHKKYPDEWKKMSSNWDEEGFTEAEINIEVTAKIRGSGYISKPTKPE